MIKTPDTSRTDPLRVYEPAEDSYLLLDALETQTFPVAPLICLEIGCGSGILSLGLSRALGKVSAAYFATDINPYACLSTRENAKMNDGGVPINVVRADILQGLDRLQGKVDVLLCNPPYVAVEETDDDRESHLRASWDGGPQGRSVTDRVINLCKRYLTPESGVAYIIFEQCNDPESVLHYARNRVGLMAETILKRRAGREVLQVVKLCCRP